MLYLPQRRQRADVNAQKNKNSCFIDNCVFEAFGRPRGRPFVLIMIYRR